MNRKRRDGKPGVETVREETPGGTPEKERRKASREKTPSRSPEKSSESKDADKCSAWQRCKGIAMSTLSVLANLTTIFALGIAIWQVCIGNWQFDRSGAQYNWFTIPTLSPVLHATTEDGVTELSMQNMLGIVISNTGRTADSIVSMRRNTANPETLTVCIPTFDEAGRLDQDQPILLGDGLVRLEPGETRLLFLVGVSEPMKPMQDDDDGSTTFRGSSFEITESITFFNASGDEQTREYDADVPDAVTDYYQGLAGYDDALDACRTLVDGGTEDL